MTPMGLYSTMVDIMCRSLYYDQPVVLLWRLLHLNASLQAQKTRLKCLSCIADQTHWEFLHGGAEETPKHCCNSTAGVGTISTLRAQVSGSGE